MFYIPPPFLKRLFCFYNWFSIEKKGLFENKMAKEPIRWEKNYRYVAHDNEPYPWHRSLYVFN